MSTELTGGAGFAFEDAVASVYLVALLTGMSPRGLSTTCTAVALQREAVGHPLDDIVLTGADELGATMQLDLQVTRSMALTAGDAKFADIVARAWQTINMNGFVTGVDRVGAACGRVAAQPERDLRALTDAARVSADATDFARRLPTFSQARKSLVEVVRVHIGTGATVTDAWQLLRHFVLLTFDLEGEGARDTVYARSLLEARVDDSKSLWSVLGDIAREVKASGGSIDLDTLERLLRGRATLRPVPSAQADLDALTQEAIVARSTVGQDIAGHHLERPTQLKAVRDAMSKARIVNIHGRPGSGKSVVLRNLADSLTSAQPFLWLKADRLTPRGWSGYRQHLGLASRAPSDILRALALKGDVIVMIDGIDRVQPEHRALVAEVVEALLSGAAGERWTILTTVRTGALDDLVDWFPLGRIGLRSNVEIGPLDDKEAKELATSVPSLRRLLFGEETVQTIARRPFFAARLSGLGAGVDGIASESDLALLWWRGGGHGAEGVPQLRRRTALLDLARAGAETLGRGVPASRVDPEALNGLIADDVMIERAGGLRVSFAHDIFFEWAFLHVLMEADDLLMSLREAGEPPALGRPVELLSQNKLNADSEAWAKILAKLEGQQVRPQWRRCWLVGPAMDYLSAAASEALQDVVLAEDGARLERMLTWCRATATISNPVVLRGDLGPDLDTFERTEIADLLPWPLRMASWERFCWWILGMEDRLPSGRWLDAILVFEVWQNVVRDISNPLSDALVALVGHWLVALEDHQHPEEQGSYPGAFPGLRHGDVQPIIGSARRFILGAACGTTARVEAYLSRLKTRTALCEDALPDLLAAAPRLSIACPSIYVDLLLAILLEPLPEDALAERRRRSQKELETATAGRRRSFSLVSLGLDELDEYDLDRLSINDDHRAFDPAHVQSAPFPDLFKHAPDEAIRFVMALANHAIEAWRQQHGLPGGDEGTPQPIDLNFPWGAERFWGGSREYCMFRGDLAPHPLGAALMSLEAWGFSQIGAGVDVDDLLARVLPGQCNAALLGIAVSWMIYSPGPRVVGLPIIAHPRVWNADIERSIRVDGTGIYSSNIGAHEQTREVAETMWEHNRRPHRHWNIRSLVPFYLFGTDRALGDQLVAELRSFPERLPFEFEEELTSKTRFEILEDRSLAWAALSDRDGYRAEEVPDRSGIRVLHAPKVDPQVNAETAARIARTNIEAGVKLFIKEMLEDGRPEEGRPSLENSVAYARELQAKPDSGVITPAEDIVAGVAAVVLRESLAGENVRWARDVVIEVLGRVWPDDPIAQRASSRAHPLRMVAAALSGVARIGGSHAEWARRELLGLIVNPLDGVAQASFVAAMEVAQLDPRFGQIAIRLKFEAAIRDVPYTRGGREKMEAVRSRRRRKAIDDAMGLLETGAKNIDVPLLPPAWIEVEGEDGQLEYLEPDRWLEVAGLSDALVALDQAAWLSDNQRAFLLTLAERLAIWVTQRCAASRGRGRMSFQDDPRFEWALGTWLGHIAAQLTRCEAESRIVRHLLIAPGERGLEVIGRFAQLYTAAAVYDASTVSEGAMDIMIACADRIPAEEAWRGRDQLPSSVAMILRALLFVPLRPANGAKRFANGDYREIGAFVPVVNRILEQCGAHPEVAGLWLTLMEKSRDHCDANVLIEQARRLLAARGATDWKGTRIPSRLANLLRHTIEAHKLDAALTQDVLSILDDLIELGDSRAAAIQRSELFRRLHRNSSDYVSDGSSSITEH